MSKPQILVIGLVGAGKSTIVSAITGRTAPSGDSAESVTTKVTAYEGNGMVLHDTPGLGDPKITTRTWCGAATSISRQKFDHLLYVMNGASPRVTNETVLLTIALKNIAKLDIRGISVVFTRATQANLTEPRAREYIEVLGKASQKTEFFNRSTPCCFFDFDTANSVTCHLRQILPRSTPIQIVDVTGNARVILRDITLDAQKVNPEVAASAKVMKNEAQCFHCDSVVSVRRKDGSMRITVVAEVKTGDLVVSYSPKTGSFFEEEVIYTHNHASDFGAKVQRSSFVKMSYITDSGVKGEFRVSSDHYVLRWASDGQPLLGPAQNVLPGEALAVVIDPDHMEEGRIVYVEMSSEPLATCFLLLTRSGYAVVDDVVASCLTSKWDAPVGRLLHPIFSQFPMVGRVKENPVVARFVAGGHLLFRLAGIPL